MSSKKCLELNLHISSKFRISQNQLKIWSIVIGTTFFTQQRKIWERMFPLFFASDKIVIWRIWVLCCFFFFSFGSKLIGKNIILENLFSLEKLHRLKKYLLPIKTLIKTNTVFCSMVTQKPVISFCSTLKIIVKLENRSSKWMNLYLHLNITEI